MSCAPPRAEAAPQHQARAGTVRSPRTRLIIETGKPKIRIRERWRWASSNPLGCGLQPTPGRGIASRYEGLRPRRRSEYRYSVFEKNAQAFSKLTSHRHINLLNQHRMDPAGRLWWLQLAWKMPQATQRSTYYCEKEPMFLSKVTLDRSAFWDPNLATGCTWTYHLVECAAFRQFQGQSFHRPHLACQ